MMLKRRFNSIVMLAVMYCFFPGCSAGSDDTHGFIKAEQSFRNLPKLKGKKLFIANSVEFCMDGRILLSVQNPDTLQNILSYVYSKNEWHGPWAAIQEARKFFQTEAKDDEALEPEDRNAMPIRTNYFFPLDSFSFSYAGTLKNVYDKQINYLDSMGRGKSLALRLKMNRAEFAVEDNSTRWAWRVPDIRRASKHLIAFNKDGSLKYLLKENDPSLPSANPFGDTATINKAIEAFRNLPELKGKAIKISMGIIQFPNCEGIRFSIQNPDILQDAMEYSYGYGQWTYPRAVGNINNAGSLLISINEIPFSAVAKIVNTYTNKAKELKLADSNIVSDIALWNNINEKKLQWRAGTKTVAFNFEFNLDGSIKSAEGK